MVPSPWSTIDEDLFDALFARLEDDKALLVKARQVNRNWRGLVDGRVTELEPNKRINEPQLSSLLRSFTGLTVINPSEYALPFRITDDTVPALLVILPPLHSNTQTQPRGAQCIWGHLGAYGCARYNDQRMESTMIGVHHPMGCVKD